jgi:glutathione gamma-glutamylcysteinyltransferase
MASSRRQGLYTIGNISR